jgi:hypothetical protein
MVAAGVTGEGTPRPITAPAPTLTGKGTGYWLPSLDHYGKAIGKSRNSG